MKPEFKILSPTAILGYGFPEASFLRGMAESPISPLLMAA